VCKTTPDQTAILRIMAAKKLRIPGYRAPTGRAAKRHAAENPGLEAKKIPSTGCWSSARQAFGFKALRPSCRWSCILLVVDETSMLNVALDGLHCWTPCPARRALLLGG